jgi:predicted nucleic acid-binding protein
MLLDTSGLLCYLHRDEVQHEDAVTFFKSAPLRLTHNYVLAEFVPLCQVRGLQRVATLAFVTELISNPHVEIVWVDESLHRTALVLLQERLDKTYSLCDAVSFVLMRRRGITDALTTDRHFEQEGYVRLLHS